VPIRFPSHVQTPAERHDFLLRLQERLRRHGARQCRQIRLARGLAAARQWHRRWFRPRNLAICRALNEIRAVAFPPNSYEVQPDDPSGPPVVPWFQRKRAVRNLPAGNSALVQADPALIEPDEPSACGLDPTEDFTTYTEVDPNSRYSITATTITVTGLTRNEDAYVYDDKGVDHFGASFEHLVDVKATSFTSSGIVHCWAVSNVVDDASSWVVNYSQAASVNWYGSGPRLYIRNFESGNLDTANASLNTQYYLTISRSNETLTCEIYTDSSRTVEYLHDTITTGVPASRTYRYIFGANSHNSGNPDRLVSAVISNLDLQEGGGPSGAAPQFMHLARMRRI